MVWGALHVSFCSSSVAGSRYTIADSLQKLFNNSSSLCFISSGALVFVISESLLLSCQTLAIRDVRFGAPHCPSSGSQVLCLPV